MESSRSPDSGQPAAGQLASMITDLEGYIDRRAAELAAPLVEQARAEAAEQVASIQVDLQRANDLTTELRRRLEIRDRTISQWIDATGVRAPSELPVRPEVNG